MFSRVHTMWLKPHKQPLHGPCCKTDLSFFSSYFSVSIHKSKNFFFFHSLTVTRGSLELMECTAALSEAVLRGALWHQGLADLNAAAEMEAGGHVSAAAEWSGKSSNGAPRAASAAFFVMISRRPVEMFSFLPCENTAVKCCQSYSRISGRTLVFQQTLALNGQTSCTQLAIIEPSKSAKGWQRSVWLCQLF